MFLTLGEASKQSGFSKATLSRAIRDGKLSAQRSPETNSFKIDPAELPATRKPCRCCAPASKQSVRNNQQPPLETEKVHLKQRLKHAFRRSGNRLSLRPAPNWPRNALPI